MWWHSPYGDRGKWRGWVCSALLHGAIALILAFFLPHLMPGTPASDEPPSFAVELAAGDIGPATGGPNLAEHPDEKAPDAPEASPQPPEPVPPPAKPAANPVHRPEAVVKPPRRPRHPAPTPPAVAPRNGAAATTRTITPGPGGGGQLGAFNVKDFLRAQIERHWNFDLSSLGASDVVVTIRLSLDPDGSVKNAEIVDDPRYTTNPVFHDIADSARRAVLVSSPLQLPPGTYDTVHDVTLSFDAKEAMR